MLQNYNKPIHLIINPRSGYGGRKYRLKELKSILTRNGLKIVEYRTKSLDDATDRARLIADDASAVITWGGDGTINAAANGLAGSDTPIVPYPAGTENLLAKELRMPSNPWAFVDVLQNGRKVRFDVGTVNGKNFLLIIGVGFDGEVVRRLASGRTGHISHLSYFWPIWRTFWGHDFPRMRIIADGQEIFDDYGLAFIGNISRYAVGLRICRDALFDDGLLDLVVFSCRAQTGLVLHAAWTLLRMHPLKGDCIYKKFKHLIIEPSDKPLETQVDGDVGPDGPLEIALAPHHINLIVPEEEPRSMFWPWKK